MYIKMIYNVTTLFKKVSQYQMAKLSNAKLKLLEHQPNKADNFEIFTNLSKITVTTQYSLTEILFLWK